MRGLAFGLVFLLSATALADPWRTATCDAAAVAANVKSVESSAGAVFRAPGHLELPADFSRRTTERAAWDIFLPLDLSRAEGIEFDILCSDLNAFRGFHVYFKSGGGWYATPFLVPQAGKWCRVKVGKGDVSKVEDKVAGWRKVSGFRIGGWRGSGVNSRIELRNLKVLEGNAAPQVAVVFGDSCASRQNDPEALGYISFARRMFRQIAALDVRAVVVSDLDFADCLPPSVKVAVFAYNPSAPDSLRAAIGAFVARGGRIFACHTTDKSVRKAAGIPDSIYVGRDYSTPTVPDKVANGLYLKHVWRYPSSESPQRMEKALADLLPECAPVVAAAIRRIEDEHTREGAQVAAMPGKNGEWRAFWIHSPFGLRTTNSWDATVAIAKAGGFNAVLPNLAMADTAFYDSKVMPVHPDVAKRGDQLAACLAACRRYGLECHVWKGCWVLRRYADKTLVERMVSEGRCQVSKDGKVNRGWLCPSHPENFRLEVETFAELARKGVDGIHLDYIRYPDDQHCFCERCRKTVRNDNITALVRAVSERVRRESPGVKISAAVFASPQRVAQDWVKWCHEGLLDFVCPMDYNTEDADGFCNLVAQQAKDVVGSGVKLRPGLGISCWLEKDHDAIRMARQIEAVRSLGLEGFAVFELDARAVAILPALHAGPTRSESAD